MRLKQFTANFFVATSLAVVVFVWHGSALSGYWRFDDPQILDFSLFHSIWGAFYSPEVWQRLGVPFVTPLLTLSYGVDIWIFGLSPYGFYLHHLAILILAAWLTYCLLLRWMSVLWAGLGSLLFLSGFPVMVVAQQLMTRHYVEGLIFAIIALLCFFESAGRYRWLAWVGGLSYLIAMTAKEVYVPLIFLLFVLEPANIGFKKLWWWRVAPFLLAVVIYTPWRLYMLGGIGGYSPQILPSPEAVMQFVAALPHLVFAHNGLGWGASFLVVVLLLAGVRRNVIRPWALAASIALLVGPLLPVVPLFSIPVGDEYFIVHRYLFLPWWALSCALVLVLSKLSVSEWPQGIPLKKWVLTLLFLSYFVLIGATVQQREARCFNELVAENEHVYHLAWHGSKADHVVIQREFVPYLDKMFGHVARIRGISPSEMPRVHEPHLHEPRVGVPANSNVNVWGYSPRSCGLDVLP